MAFEWKDELLSKVDLVQIVSRYVPLKRKGKTYWGCCPFHHEKTPSFAVNADKQFYHCFGCKESGNAITFIEKMESVDFIDAVKILAAEAKMELPQFTKNENSGGMTREKRERLYSLMKEAARHYHDNLSSPKAKNAVEYIQKRDIPNNLVTKFGLGVSLNGDEIISFLESKGYTKSEMKTVGIIEQRGAEYYDVFYGRLIVPIINNFGEVVAFGGRLINPLSHVPMKYRNTSATVLFDKSKILYAVNLLKKKKQRENIDYVIVTEGYMDVIALHKAGFDTAVASMGTAFTLAQAKLIRNYTNNVFVSFDGDTAGQSATMRGLDILQEAGLKVKVVSLPDGMDPDDVIKKYGRDGYMKLLKEAQVLPAFKLNSAAKRYDIATPDGKSAYAIEAVKIIKALDNPVEQEEYLKIVHERTGYSFDVLRMQANLITDEERKKEIVQAESKKNEPEREQKTDGAELFVVASIVHSMPYATDCEDLYPYLSNTLLRDVYGYVVDRRKKGIGVYPSALFSDFAGRDGLSDVVSYEFLDGDNETKFKRCLNVIKLRYVDEEKKKLAAEYDRTKNAELLKELVRLDEMRREIKNGGY